MDIQQALPLLGGMTPQHFMQRHWQRKPLLIRQAIPGFTPPLDRTDLLDLAAQEEVQSRLVVQASAGGEQPKFTAELDDADGQRKHLIVKFSPPRGTPFGERWHDLLHLEHLALSVLADNGTAVATTHIVESAERTYLMSERFDRLGLKGKRHVVSAAAVHDEFVKAPRRHWVATCAVLAEQDLLTHADMTTVAGVYLFGQAIGNTDMHFGNLSFYVDDVMQPKLLPTPIYDMLPMLWRPSIHGGELSTALVQAQIQPMGYAPQVALARTWARDYWDRAANLAALSRSLREASALNLDRLA